MPPEPTPPLLCRLLAARSGLPPAEVDGPTYRPQIVAFLDRDGQWAANVDEARFTRMPACLVVAVEVQDVEHRRLWVIPTATPVPIAAGAEVLIPAGALLVHTADLAAVDPAHDPGPLAVGVRLGDGAPRRSQANTRS